MSYREKSAWVMSVVMLLASMFYAKSALSYPGSPVLETVVPYVLLVVILSVAAQVVLALRSPKEASKPADEREQLANARAGYWSGIVLAVGIVIAGAVYSFAPSGNMLFHHSVFALIAAQLVQYGLEIVYLRRAI